MTDPAQERRSLEISEERVSKIWAGVTGALGAPGANSRRRRQARLSGALLAAALFAIAVILAWPENHRKGSGAILTTRTDTLAVTLDEGSQLELGSETQLAIDQANEEHVVLKLHQGSVTCEVPHKKGRTFLVRAGDVEVRVVGTRFSVEHDATDRGARVFVRVERGVVEVKRHGSDGFGKRIGAGQLWTSEERLVIPPVEADSSGAPVGDHDEPGALPAPPEAPPAQEKGSAAAYRPPREPRVQDQATAEQAFERASALRRAGQGAAAASAYERFVEDFPADPRTALAAFEKARLQMDVLGQARAARSSLELALRLSPRAGFREDVLARLARVEMILGNSGACRTARERYLREYPKGVHREATLRLCPLQ